MCNSLFVKSIVRIIHVGMSPAQIARPYPQEHHQQRPSHPVLIVENALRRYAFVLLDGDMDGLVAAETIDLYDMFAPYSPAVLAWALRHWRYESCIPLVFTMDDFVRFVEYADDRSSPESIKFWFSCLDYDADGCVAVPPSANAK